VTYDEDHMTMNTDMQAVLNGEKDGAIVCGDCQDVMRTMPDSCVHMVVTSPPYWGLRDYGIAGQLGLESTPDEYIAKMVAVFREVRRVLRDDGTLWLNMGDSYAAGGNGGHQKGEYFHGHTRRGGDFTGQAKKPPEGLKLKDLCGIPWRLALALQADGWWLRQDIIWNKTNPMPESVTDRCTKAHEYLFLLAKRPKYFYDAEAVKEDCDSGPSDIRKMLEGKERIGGKHKILDDPLSKASMHTNIGQKRSVGDPSGRNRRSVWTIPTEPFRAAHFATYPKELVRPCIRAGTSAKGVCPACGTPWRRVVERKATGWDGSTYGDRAVSSIGGAISGGTKASTLGSSNGKLVAKHETTGWKPSCDCFGRWYTYSYCDNGQFRWRRYWRSGKHPRLSPPVVFDPFGGSGTTGQVAAQEGRAYILIELNAEYAEMARRERLAPVETAVPVKEARAGQLALFEGQG
jgi:DNA modification methylase